MPRPHDQTIARCLIDNADWQDGSPSIAGIDEPTCATLRTSYGHLMGQMPHDRSLFDADQIAY